MTKPCFAAGFACGIKAASIADGFSLGSDVDFNFCFLTV